MEQDEVISSKLSKKQYTKYVKSKTKSKQNRDEDELNHRKSKRYKDNY